MYWGRGEDMEESASEQLQCMCIGVYSACVWGGECRGQRLPCGEGVGDTGDCARWGEGKGDCAVQGYGGDHIV